MKSLTRAEEEVMLVLWSLDKAFLKNILDNWTVSPPHPNTISTILKILVQKGFVKYSIHGRNNLYTPIITKEQYGSFVAEQLIRNYYGNSPHKLVLHFIHENQLSIEEWQNLGQFINPDRKGLQ